LFFFSSFARDTPKTNPPPSLPSYLYASPVALSCFLRGSLLPFRTFSPQPTKQWSFFFFFLAGFPFGVLVPSNFSRSWFFFTLSRGPVEDSLGSLFCASQIFRLAKFFFVSPLPTTCGFGEVFFGLFPVAGLCVSFMTGWSALFHVAGGTHQDFFA